MTEEQKDNKPETGKRDKKFTNVIITILLNIIITITSIYIIIIIFLNQRKNNQNIVGVDIKGFLEKQKAGLVSGKISEEQFKANRISSKCW